jgi:hypothetical protein
MSRYNLLTIFKTNFNVKQAGIFHKSILLGASPTQNGSYDAYQIYRNNAVHLTD